MLTFLDLLVVVFMILATVSLLALCLMFLVHKPIVRKVCFYIVEALGIYVATVGVRINGYMFPGQSVIAVLAGIACIAALVLERMSKGDEKKFLIARILSAAALVVGICNAFLF